MSQFVLAIRAHPSLAKQRHEIIRLQIKREAERRQAHPSMSAPDSQTLPPESASGAVARHANKRCRLPALRARSPLGAPLAALATQINAMAQPRPCFLGRARGGRYPPSAVPVQRSTPRTGHSAGQSDARAARERGYESRPREPHPPRQSAVTGDVPSMSEILAMVAEIGTSVKTRPACRDENTSTEIEMTLRSAPYFDIR